MPISAALSATSMWAAAIGAGSMELTIVPSGHRSSMGAKIPSSYGRSLAISHATWATISLSMM